MYTNITYYLYYYAIVFIIVLGANYREGIVLLRQADPCHLRDLQDQELLRVGTPARVRPCRTGDVPHVAFT